MVSTSGRKLMNDDAIEIVKRELFPLVSLVTPNLAEVEELPGKMLLCGHVDYMDFCRALGQAMGAEETEKEEAAQDAKAGPIEQTE